jgi:Protein of unknown function (DUF2844)
MLGREYQTIPIAHPKRPMTSHTIAATSSTRLHVTCSALALTLVTPWISAVAWAHLGGDVASVQADTAALRAQIRTTPTMQYDVHEISHDGLVVHEYSTRQGQVFAVTWQGPFKPDLRQLLGGYFAAFQSATSQPRAGSHRAFALSRPDLVVVSTGHMRAFQGFAYIPALVPGGVSVQQLQ